MGDVVEVNRIRTVSDMICQLMHMHAVLDAAFCIIVEMDHAHPDGRRIYQMDQLTGILSITRAETARILEFAESIDGKIPEDA